MKQFLSESSDGRLRGEFIKTKSGAWRANLHTKSDRGPTRTETRLFRSRYRVDNERCARAWIHSRIEFHEDFIAQ